MGKIGFGTLALITGSLIGLAFIQPSLADTADTQVAAAESSAAESLPDNVTSATTQVQPSTTILDKFYVNYFGTYHGGTLSDMGGSHTVNQIGAPSAQAIYFDSEVTTAYMITPTIGVGPDIPFYLSPVKGQGATIQDVGIKTFDRQLISYNGFNMYANLIIQAPTSDYSRGRNEEVGIKSTPNFRYNFPASRFAVGAWTELKDYVGVTSGKQFKTYAAPYVNYTLTPTLSLNLEYEMEADKMYDTQGIDFTNYGTDLQPGFVWLITPKVLVNPYVMVFTGNHVNTDTAAVGAVISATLL